MPLVISLVCIALKEDRCSFWGRGRHVVANPHSGNRV